MSRKSNSTVPRSIDKLEPSDKHGGSGVARAPYGQQPQPQRESENTEEGGFEKSEDSPIDDPGDAQRSSKTGLDGDGEEEMR
jgi:hypothetical protein